MSVCNRLAVLALALIAVVGSGCTFTYIESQTFLPSDSFTRRKRVEGEVHDIVALVNHSAPLPGKEGEPLPPSEAPTAESDATNAEGAAAESSEAIKGLAVFAGKVAALKFQGWTPEEKTLAPELLKTYESGTELVDQDNGGVGDALVTTRFLSPTGSVLDLDDYLGQSNVVLVFMRGYSEGVCLRCSAQLVALSKAEHDFNMLNTKVIIVYPGKPEAVPAFIKAARTLNAEYELPYPIVLDVNLEAVKAFNIVGTLAKPTTIIVGKDGLVKWQYVGANPNDRPPVPVLLEKVAEKTTL